MELEESFLKELDFEKCTEEDRLKTFKSWPYEGNCQCTIEKMAEAGFYHCPTDKEPDLARCYVCYKELDGWEADDDPWKEHESHSPNCLFVKFRKKESELTIEEFLKLECERQINKLKAISNKRIKEFTQLAEDIENKIIDDI